MVHYDARFLNNQNRKFYICVKCYYGDVRQPHGRLTVN